MSKYTNAKYPDKINDLIDNEGKIDAEKVIASGIQVLTEAPVADNPEKDIKFVYLDEEPVERFNGYYYLIGSGSGSGSVDLVKPILKVQKGPVPNTGYLEEFFFNRELKPEQVDSLLTNANLTLMDMGDGLLAYPMLIADAEIELNRKLWLIVDLSAKYGLASGTAWSITEMMHNIMYYVSPAVAPQLDAEAGWQKAAFASDDTNYVTVDANLMESVPFPVGAQNDLLTELVYAYPVIDTGKIELAKSLTGQYKIVEKNIKLNIEENTTYSYDFINGINDDTKEIGVIKNIKIDIKRKDEDAIISGNITTYANNRAHIIRSYAFADCSWLETVSLPNVTDINSYAFYSCSRLTSVEMPSVRKIRQSAFWNCHLKTITFPQADFVSDEAFSENTYLTEANLPKVTEIGRKAFYNCHSLIKVFITEDNCTLGGGAFDGCDHILGNPGGLKDGYIYVPARSLSRYKTATNWQNYASQIVGHEDLKAGAALPNYTTSSFSKQTWYSDEKLTTVVTSVATTGKYYCKLSA